MSIRNQVLQVGQEQSLKNAMLSRSSQHCYWISQHSSLNLWKVNTQIWIISCPPFPQIQMWTSYLDGSLVYAVASSVPMSSSSSHANANLSSPRTTIDIRPSFPLSSATFSGQTVLPVQCANCRRNLLACVIICRLVYQYFRDDLLAQSLSDIVTTLGPGQNSHNIQ